MKTVVEALIHVLAQKYANTTKESRDDNWHEQLDALIYALEDAVEKAKGEA